MIERLDLPLTNGTHLLVNPDRYAKTAEELESFILDLKHLKTKSFATDVMFSHEIKANNSVEGYFDDVELIKNVIENKIYLLDEEQKQRIQNLWHGYNYILKGEEINQDSLKKLYGILSKNLLESDDLSKMGEYYREDPVYIHYSRNVSAIPAEGVPAEDINYYMDAYFNFLNNADFGDTMTSEYIKSQILHFYFVYIHPYFDVNGRTSRTVSMWYLLNKKAYPFIIFNRGINFKKTDYYKAIQDVRKYSNISFFINYMLETVQEELEKEYIMQAIVENSGVKFTAEDWQSLLYILSMKGTSNLTIADFTNMYNRFNVAKKPFEVYSEILMPLLEKEIIILTNETNNYILPNIHNYFFELNPDYLEYDHNKIKRLTRYR